MANLLSLDPGAGVFGLVDLASQLGPIFCLEFGPETVFYVSSQELVDEVCDEARFDKKVHGALWRVRDFAADGLFTAKTREDNWGLAHRILMPAFGPAALRDMFDGMVDISEQLLLKWERFGESRLIDVTDDTTRLTLDAIALCSFTHRFNSLYSEQMNPFVDAMVRALIESGTRSMELPHQSQLRVEAFRQYEEDKRLMHEVADQLVQERRRHPLPEGQHDILETMMTATDAQTGERLSDENIRYQLVTFLIAGHETTSGMLTFTIYELLRNPDLVARLRSQVDEVCGNRAPGFADLAKLTLIDRVFKESLRLWPTAPAFTVQAREDTLIGGRYAVRRGQAIVVILPALHRDPHVWGEDADEFNPDRWEFDRASTLPANAWKPFGNGQRSCIGRGFALQEATLFVAMLLQRFDLMPGDPNYQMKLKETLTIKPEGLTMRLRRRATTISPAAQESAAASSASPSAQVAIPAIAAGSGIPIRVLFGSNAGSSQAFADRIANDARQRGFVSTVEPLDAATGHLSREGAVIIVTSSYEGQAPDNARLFTAWLKELPEGSLEGVRYAVFGCGNTDWARTYQAVPVAIDHNLERAGATRLMPRGEADARGDFFGDFDDWYSDFWGPVGAAFGEADVTPPPSTMLQVDFTGTGTDSLLRVTGLDLGTVVANRELVDMTAPGARSKRHVEIALPEGMTYETGDYLSVLPLNPAASVDRALQRFDLTYDARLVIHATNGGHTFLPTDTAVTAGEVLASYVELSMPATRKQIQMLADVAVCPPDREELLRLAGDEVHATEILGPRVSALALLERFPACTLAFASFLQMLTPLTPRRYSIASSPRWSPKHAALTVAVLRTPATTGQGTYEGVASTYLANARPGSRVAVEVRPSNVAFAPPKSLATPLVMVCAGSGIAPFRGFLQDRALAAEEQGVTPAPALLFFGCDSPTVDFLYRDELERWAEQGVVDIRPVFSEAPENGHRFVQDRLWDERAEVVSLVDQGAVFFVCGDGQRMAPAVHDTCAKIYSEATGASADEADAWMTEMEREHGRYVADVFV